MKLTAEEIRNEFIGFVGDEKYRHFVLTLYEAFPPRDRLFFWQEKLLIDFSNEFNIDPISFEIVHKIFNHCPVHHFELKDDNVLIVSGENVGSKIPYEKQREIFPMAHIDAPRDLERFSYPKTVDIVYCEKCRELRKHTIAK